MHEFEARLKESRHPWSVGHKLTRGLWLLAWNVLGRWGPRAFSPWRVRLLRLFGARIGRDVLVCGNVKVLMPWHLEVGDQVALSEEVDIYNFGFVRIGHNSCLSRGVWVCTGSHDYSDPTFPLTWKDISIGHSVWVAAQCFISPGVHIGDGAVVAPRAVVTRDLEPWGVYGGNPCKWIKPRRTGEPTAPRATAPS